MDGWSLTVTVIDILIEYKNTENATYKPQNPINHEKRKFGCVILMLCIK